MKLKQATGLWLAVTLLMCIGLVGCDGGESSTITAASSPDDKPRDDPQGAGECSPDEESWGPVREVLSARCGFCHGETIQYGAPFSLLDYGEITQQTEGETTLMKVVQSISSGRMPPAGQPPLSESEYATIMEWTTCGEDTPLAPHGPMFGGIDVNRAVYRTPDTAPDGDSVDFLADDGHIAQDVSDRYACYSFAWPTSDRRLIRRIEPIIDDTRVVHHMLLYAVESGPGDGREVNCGANLSAMLYGWAPGAQALQFVDGALRAEPETKYLLEIHYNNEARHDDVADRSGVRVFYEEPGATEFDLLALGPEGFLLPAGERTEVTGSCAIDEPLTIIATSPHMHELGASMVSTVIRKNGESENLITLRNWDFDVQLYYDAERMLLEPGDRIETKCVYENTTGQDARYGPFTKDEMCYNFLYVTPPPSDRRCDDPALLGPYEPGECAPEEATSWAERRSGSFHEGGAPTPEGGEIVPGIYRLEKYDIYLDATNLGPINISLERSQSEGYGVMKVESDLSFILDIQGLTQAQGENGSAFEIPVSISTAGAFADDDASDATVNLVTRCPSETERPQVYSATAVGFSLFADTPPPSSGTVVFEFARIAD